MLSKLSLPFILSFSVNAFSETVTELFARGLATIDNDVLNIKCDSLSSLKNMNTLPGHANIRKIIIRAEIVSGITREDLKGIRGLKLVAIYSDNIEYASYEVVLAFGGIDRFLKSYFSYYDDCLLGLLK